MSEEQPATPAPSAGNASPAPGAPGQTGDSRPRRNRRRKRRPNANAPVTTSAQTSTPTTAPDSTQRNIPRPKKRQPKSPSSSSTKRKPTGRGRAPLRLPSRNRQPSEFGTNWWARRWLAALEKFGWLARLERGRDYARRGNVLDLDITPGSISAQVQGSRPWPYKVEIGLQPLTDEQWDRVIRRLGRQALYAAKLLAGDMPQNIEDIFNAADIALIPKTSSAFSMSCTCPDEATPCKHIAAVHYVLGQEFDRDPFVLFELRGRTRQDIVKALQGRPSTEVAGALPLAPSVNGQDVSSLENFWKSPALIEEFAIHIAPAAVPGGLLKRLGPLPLRGQSDDWRTQLFDVYRLVSRRAYALGRGDDRSREPAPAEASETPEAAEA